MKLEHFLTRFTKINSKWTKDLIIIETRNIRKCLENICRTIFERNGSDFFFLYLFSKAKETNKQNEHMGLNLA